MTYKLYGYDTGTSLWIDFSDASGSLDYIVTAFDDTNGKITVENADGTKTTTGDLKPQTNILLKIVVTSTWSRSSFRVVEDEFTLVVYDETSNACPTNKVAFDPSGSYVYANHYGTSVVSDVNYEIGDTVNIDPKYSTI